MDWLFPSVIATLAGTLVLAGTYFYLYSHDRQKFLLIWGIGWLSHAARDIFMLLSLAVPPLFNTALLFIANQLAALSSGMLLLWGTYVFMRRPFPRAWLLFALVNASWIVGSSIAKLSFTSQTISTYFFLGLVYIWTGIVILRHNLVLGAGRNFTACAFILWG
ncbi:MAG: histidine kinase, partial [Desulfobulbaceae bacterium]